MALIVLLVLLLAVCRCEVVVGPLGLPVLGVAVKEAAAASGAVAAIAMKVGFASPAADTADAKS
jgi:hypothetical protein